MSEYSVPTVRINSDANESGYKIINRSDFDPKVHTLFESNKAEVEASEAKIAEAQAAEAKIAEAKASGQVVTSGPALAPAPAPKPAAPTRR